MGVDFLGEDFLFCTGGGGVMAGGFSGGDEGGVRGGNCFGEFCTGGVNGGG